MWRASWESDIPLTRTSRSFLSCMSRFVTHGGRFNWSGIGVLIQQLSQQNGRPYTQRHVLRLLAQSVALGLIRRVRHSAPGRPAVYEAVIPDHPGYRPVKVRRRGLRPRRLMAAWRREAVPAGPALFSVQEAAGAPTRPAASTEHRHMPEALSDA